MKILIYALLIAGLFSSCMNPTSSDEPELILIDSAQLSLGEGAIWDAAFNRLFYIDIMGKKLFEYYPGSGKKNTYEMPSMIGTVVVKSEQEVLVALENGIYAYHLNNRTLDFITNPSQNDSTQRFNDGKCDPSGRFWVGTMSLRGEKGSSQLFCLDNDGTLEMKLSGISVSNGIVWSSDKKHMYYIDTPTRKVMEYKYDDADGSISDPRVAVQVADSLGAPDGMTIDQDNHLWVCMWGGSAVCCFNPESGELIKQYKIPAKNVTSCAFAGKNEDELYITTARINSSDDDLKRFPNAGCLFKLNLKKSF